MTPITPQILIMGGFSGLTPANVADALSDAPHAKLEGASNDLKGGLVGCWSAFNALSGLSRLVQLLSLSLGLNKSPLNREVMAYGGGGGGGAGRLLSAPRACSVFSPVVGVGHIALQRGRTGGTTGGNAFNPSTQVSSG